MKTSSVLCKLDHIIIESSEEFIATLINAQKKINKNGTDILDSNHCAKCNIFLGIWASLRGAESIITSYCISLQSCPS